MIPVAAGCLLLLLVMFDIIHTTLTTKGEGFLSAVVSDAFRKCAMLAVRRSPRTSEMIGPASILALGAVWLGGLWAGWVLVFLGLPDALEHSERSTIDLYDLIYFVGFTLSTLGIGDITPRETSAQVATVLASFNGLLVITLIVTYALSVVGGEVARRVLAYRISLAGEEDDLRTGFSTVNEFTAWLAEIRKDLISCTEQRLAYPVLDNFVSTEPEYSLAIQLARLGIASHREAQNRDISERSRRELNALLSVLYRYTSLAGINDDDLVVRLTKLAGREGWKRRQDV